MTGLVLATENAEFEARVRDAFDGELDGPLRYWRDDLLDDPRECVRALANGGTRVVALGPGLSEDQALQLAQTFDEQRPDISVLIVAKPSTGLLRSALRAGARDVISPETPSAELHEAIERAFTTAANRGNADDDEGSDRRVIVTLCPKGGAGKTTLSSNLALGLAKAVPGDTVILDLDLQFGDVASGARPHARAHLQRRDPRARRARRDHAQGAPHVAPRRAVRPVRAAVADRRRPPHHRARRAGGAPARGLVPLRDRRHAVGPRREHARGDGVRHRSHPAVGHRHPEHPQHPQGDRRAARHRQAAAAVARGAQPRRREDRPHHPGGRAGARRQGRRRHPELACRAVVAQPGRTGDLRRPARTVSLAMQQIVSRFAPVAAAPAGGRSSGPFWRR